MLNEGWGLEWKGMVIGFVIELNPAFPNAGTAGFVNDGDDFHSFHRGLVGVNLSFTGKSFGIVRSAGSVKKPDAWPSVARNQDG